MKKPKITPVITKKIDSESDIKINGKKIYFTYSADVSIDSNFEVHSVDPYMIFCADENGDEMEPSGNEMQYIVKEIDRHATNLAIEKTSSADFESEEEEY